MPAMRATRDDRKNCPGRTKNADIRTRTRKPAPVHHDDTISRYRDKNNRPRTPRGQVFQLQGQQRDRSPVPVLHGDAFPCYRDNN